MGSGEWGTGLPYYPLPQSWFDQTVIPVLAFVNYANAIRLRVSEDQEVFGRLANLHHRLFGGHRLDRIAPRTDDARVVPLGLDLRQWAWGDRARRRGTMFAGDDFPLDLERLSPQTVYGLRRRDIHIRRVGFTGQGMFLPIDDYLRQVTVMLAHAQDDVGPGRPVKHRVELPKMMGDMFSDGRRNREVAACEFDLHPNAPFFHARSGGDRGGRLPDGSVCSTAFRRKSSETKPFRLK